MRVIISGGGTGGHIFPAIAIAQAILAQRPDAQILFVGAEGRMEMEKVPAAGFTIVGLPIVGIQRRLTWKNLLVPIKVWQSLRKARSVIKEFKPDIAIGVGGYASGPLLRVAGSMGIPTLIQEQNSYPGITNKILAKKAAKICVAYDNMQQFFPQEKIVLTGNPVRPEVGDIQGKRERALQHFQLEASRKTLLVVGGSLGARTINEAIRTHAASLIDGGLQIVWQTGKNYAATAEAAAAGVQHLHAHAFIKEMDLAYAAADLIVSRAGAMSISELCLMSKPVIFVPSPNVSEDHQTKNAMALVNKDAAVLVRDAEAQATLSQAILSLAKDEARCKTLSGNIVKLGKARAAQEIATIALQLAGKA